MPKPESTTAEAYLELPEDATNFPIEVTESDESAQISEDDAESLEEENNALDSDEDGEL